MGEKERVLTLLRQESERWEEMLASLGEARCTSLQLPNGWTVKDLMAHLMAWQQVTNARLEAAVHGGEPSLPGWLDGSDPESESEIDTFNARIFEMYRDEPWARVHALWRAGFARVLRLAEEVPEDVMLDSQRFAWLKGYPLLAVLEGTYGHHHRDHYPVLAARVEQIPDGGTSAAR